MASEEVLFCTELIGLRVFDTRGRKIGRVKDAALVPIIDPARIDRFLVGGGWAWLSIRYDQVRSISLKGIYPQGREAHPLSFRRVHAPDRPRPARSADHRFARPEGRSCNRCHVPNQAGGRL